MTVNAFNSADWPVIKAVTVLGSVLYVLFNLLSDLLYAKADPRVVLS
jgi:ABC-type dipeptide/oligopeptide/nickel transport system permease component